MIPFPLLTFTLGQYEKNKRKEAKRGREQWQVKFYGKNLKGINCFLLMPYYFNIS